MHSPLKVYQLAKCMKVAPAISHDVPYELYRLPCRRRLKDPSLPIGILSESTATNQTIISQTAAFGIQNILLP